VGFLVSGRAERIFARKDASRVVIDETAGMMLCFLFIPYKLSYTLVAFVLFRILDIAKPFPARRAEDLSGSAGVMVDDIICAVYTNILLRIFIMLGL
jgi:phosphatidylglycerophosphatase A